MSEAFRPLLGRLVAGEVLGGAEAEAFFAACLKGEPSPAQVGAALTALRMRGETPGEIAAGARAMRAAAVRLETPFPTLDVCGTGGDGLHTLNVSTAVAFVAAGGGVKVAKHGNRALSSKSGTADVLAALGVDIEARPDRQLRALEEAGVCFLFAQAHHGAMRHVSPIRAELGFRTLFNLLGPLTNPAGASRQVLGVFDRAWLEPVAEVLRDLGSERAWVVHGQGMDELTTTGEAEVVELKDGALRRFKVHPSEAGLPEGRLEDLVGGDPQHNAEALRALLSGAPGAYRHIVLLNAAAAFLVADRVRTLAEGVGLAGQVIDDGRALAALDALVRISNGR
ncbi:MAG: anthranilate phosphoribosyltransferase [Phenylobacterium sp.]|nr:anthranilate phosphoribosyltransferase [Phenylobacterium sp.]